MSTQVWTDEELVRRLASGDETALAELVRRYQQFIFRFCAHYVDDAERAKELAQETFLRVYLARGRFDETRRFKPWVLCIARNLCLNELKHRRIVRIESIEVHPEAGLTDGKEVLHSVVDTPDDQAMAAERRAVLAEALDTLDDESRELVILRYYERMPAREIAETMGTTEGAVRTRLHRVLQTLRQRYEGRKDEL